MTITIESDLALFIDTVDFAARKHSTQRRKDPERTPYINHPIGVANNLRLAGVTDIVALQAAILHDTVEDTATTEEELREHFGPEVAAVVMECTDDKSLPSAARKAAQIAHAPSISHRAKLVKLADKLYNLRDLKRSLPVGWTEQRRREYFAWAGRVVQGLRGANAEMEAQIDLVTKEYLASAPP